MNDEFDAVFDDEDTGEIEAYCMTCRAKTPMENPQPIWTRRGAPGTRGTCSVCGTTVFLMGKTAAHSRTGPPEPLQVPESSPGKGGRKRQSDAMYLNFCVSDTEFAEILADDLKRIGIQTWMAEEHVKDAQWATGVHPALLECKSMIVVLTPLGIKATNVVDAIDVFASARKPIVVAQLQPADLPDALRRKPRFDFSGEDYKSAFRELVQALTE
jgi:hypothetical protein